MPDTKSNVEIASAISRIQALHEAAFTELPLGYTYESLQYTADVLVVTEFARGVLALMVGR
jgi:hypothetical protein